MAAGPRTRCAVIVALQVGGAVVGHDALDGCAERAEEGAASREGRAGGVPLVAEQLGVCDAGEVDDYDVRERSDGGGRDDEGPSLQLIAVGHPFHLLNAYVHELGGGIFVRGACVTWPGNRARRLRQERDVEDTTTSHVVVSVVVKLATGRAAAPAPRP